MATASGVRAQPELRAGPPPWRMERAAPDFATEMFAIGRGPPLAPAPTFDVPMFDSPLQSAANTAMACLVRACEGPRAIGWGRTDFRAWRGLPACVINLCTL